MIPLEWNLVASAVTAVIEFLVYFAFLKAGAVDSLTYSLLMNAVTHPPATYLLKDSICLPAFLNR